MLRVFLMIQTVSIWPRNDANTQKSARLQIRIVVNFTLNHLIGIIADTLNGQVMKKKLLHTLVLGALKGGWFGSFSQNNWQLCVFGWNWSSQWFCILWIGLAKWQEEWLIRRDVWLLGGRPPYHAITKQTIPYCTVYYIVPYYTYCNHGWDDRTIDVVLIPSSLSTMDGGMQGPWMIVGSK